MRRRRRARRQAAPGTPCTLHSARRLRPSPLSTCESPGESAPTSSTSQLRVSGFSAAETGAGGSNQRQ